MPKYEVWRTGFICTGMDSPAKAKKLGETEADSFKEACIELLKDNPDFDKERFKLWGCGLYDNETEARKQFG